MSAAGLLRRPVRLSAVKNDSRQSRPTMSSADIVGSCVPAFSDVQYQLRVTFSITVTSCSSTDSKRPYRFCHLSNYVN